MKKYYFWAFIFFGILFIVSAFIWLGASQGPSPRPPVDEGTTAVTIALITAVVSLIGSVITLVLGVRKERREQRLAQGQLALQQAELEKVRLELDQLKREQAPPKKQDEA